MVSQDPNLWCHTFTLSIEAATCVAAFQLRGHWFLRYSRPVCMYGHTGVYALKCELKLAHTEWNLAISPITQQILCSSILEIPYNILQSLTQVDTEHTKQRGHAPALNGAWLCMGGVWLLQPYSNQLKTWVFSKIKSMSSHLKAWLNSFPSKILHPHVTPTTRFWLLPSKWTLCPTLVKHNPGH